MQLDLLDHLLKLASPQDGAELLLRLEQDLNRVAAAIDLSLSSDDRTSLGAALHVLVGISGSVGADQLCADARTLGQAAKDASPLAAAPLTRIRQGIAALRGEVLRRTASGRARA